MPITNFDDTESPGIIAITQEELLLQTPQIVCMMKRHEIEAHEKV